MRKPLIAIVLITMVVLAQLIATAPLTRRSLRTQLNPSYLQAMAAYKRLEPKLTHEELRAITTIGILNGAKKAEEQMEEHLIQVIKDLVENTDVNDRKSVVPKITKIEQQLARDQHALGVLTTAMDLAMGKMNVKEFRREMQHTLKEVRRKADDNEELKEKPEDQLLDETAHAADISGRVRNLRQNIMNQVTSMKHMVDEKIEDTLEHIIEEADNDGLIAQASDKIVRKRAASDVPEEPAEVRLINSILSEADFRQNLVENGREKRKDEGNSLEDEFDEFDLDEMTKKVIANRSSSETSIKGRVVNGANKQNSTNAAASNTVLRTSSEIGRPAKQEEASGETSDDAGGGGGGGGGGGLVGIISSLSGGEGGSDIGALIGALTGVISMLFGPGGLDIESLISTGTSLISGLLAGNKNFGTVLGIYVGTAFDGLSGGGGAINNGEFIGNFLGTVVASLSADPEDDDQPPKPFLFAQTLFNTFLEAKNRKESSDETQDRKGVTASHAHAPPEKPSSDSGAFVKHFASHVVNTVLSVILNAALGASGGASHASTSLFAHASNSHQKPAS